MSESQLELWQTKVEERINGHPHAPPYVLKGSNGSTPVDLIQVGMILECQDLVNPEVIWFVKIIQNVGGRLRLRYEGDRRRDDDDDENGKTPLVSASFPQRSTSFWIFYSSPLLHPIGWGVANGFDYRPPLRIIVDDDSFPWWVETLRKTLFSTTDNDDNKFIPREVFAGQPTLAVRHFSVGMKVEAIDPEAPEAIAPATIV